MECSRLEMIVLLHLRNVSLQPNSHVLRQSWTDMPLDSPHGVPADHRDMSCPNTDVFIDPFDTYDACRNDEAKTNASLREATCGNWYVAAH